MSLPNTNIHAESRENNKDDSLYLDIKARFKVVP